MKPIIVLTLLLAVTSVAFAACPNKCSGHGTCGENDLCACEENWINADCSGRKCPYVRAWHDAARGDNDAHYYAECANRGTCDRNTGLCDCDYGFAGRGCRRMECPNECSGHGTCEFMEDLATEVYHKRTGGVASRKYTLWDREKIMGCVCDGGWEGHACQNRVCPVGDDPLTTENEDMRQYIDLSAITGSIFLTYFDPYGNAFTTEAISLAGSTCANIQTALRKLPNYALNGVTAVSTATLTNIANAAVNKAGSGELCQIDFPATPGTTGKQSLLECTGGTHSAAGQHPITSTAATCTVGQVKNTKDLTELATCSNRGLCDAATGTCQCFTGHSGLACESQEALV